MILLAIDFGEPVILKHCSIKEPGHKVALESKVNKVGGNGAHFPKYPDVNDSDVNPGDEAGAEELFMVDMAVMDLNDGVIRVVA
jgi:hypothetical protein